MSKRKVVETKTLTFFTPANSPEVVLLADDSAVVGPFCTHCQLPRGSHLDNQPVRKRGTDRIEYLDAVCPPESS